MNRKELSQRYWKYYLMLESRFMDSIEYVELHKDNESAFSNGYALLIQAVGAELDTVFKEYCGFNTADTKNITHYANYILESDINIKEMTIVIPEYDMEIKPFENWDKACPKQSLLWWVAFDDMKHNRYEQLHSASQKNTLNILGALYLVEMLLLKKITDGTSELDVFDESSKLFTLKDWTTKAVPLGESFAVLAEMIASDDGEVYRSFDA